MNHRCISILVYKQWHLNRRLKCRHEDMDPEYIALKISRTASHKMSNNRVHTRDTRAAPSNVHNDR